MAAFQLEESGQSPFSAEALIVSAWQKYPRTFGLKGYAEQYPDANKVLASIMGEKGLAKKGWLVKMGQKLYALTREGRQMVRRLRDEDGEEPAVAPPAPITLGAEQDRLLQALYSSTAWQKFGDGRKADLSFADACRFWNITEHLPASSLDQRLQLLGKTLNEIEKKVGPGTLLLANGRSLQEQDLTHLTELHDYLEDRFERHLMLLRNRAERR